MSAKFSGQNFDVTIHGVLIHVKNASATITDDSAVAKTRGMPDGWTQGGCACETEYELDLNNFRKLQSAARSAGSWRAIEPDDCMFYANNGSDEDKIELYGVKLMITDLLSVDPESSDKTTRKIKGFVTSPLFVKINGIPYLSDDDTRNLI